MTMQDFIERLLAHMGIDQGNVSITEEESLTKVHIQVSEEDSGLLIGYHGETLAAIQKIVQLAHSTPGQPLKLVMNVNDYKERRKAQLEENVARIAERVLSSGRTYTFDYLPSNERLVVHQFISESPDFQELESVSTGEGDKRRLEIRLKVKNEEVAA